MTKPKPVPAPSDFGGRLRAVREREGMTQQDLANRSGLHQVVISELESGRRLPSWETACKLAEALGCSLDAFRGKE